MIVWYHFLHLFLYFDFDFLLIVLFYSLRNLLESNQLQIQHQSQVQVQHHNQRLNLHHNLRQFG